MAENEGGFPVEDGQIRWYEDTDIGSDALQEFEDAADEILAYAQANAPWSDRTGDARAGLQTEVFEEGGDIVLELYHTVEYGQWLETIQDGGFAIIMPTLELFAPQVFARVGGKVESIEGEDYSE